MISHNITSYAMLQHVKQPSENTSLKDYNYRTLEAELIINQNNHTAYPAAAPITYYV
jgi:hypothetical protein